MAISVQVSSVLFGFFGVNGASSGPNRSSALLSASNGPERKETATLPGSSPSATTSAITAQ